MRICKVEIGSNYVHHINEAVSVLKKGGSVIYPTDTVYGLGCNACDYKAVEQIYRIKDRTLDKPLSVIARNMAWVKEIAVVPTKLEPILNKLWPGAVTVILPRKSVIPSIVTAGGDTVGVRVPASQLTDWLMGRFGYPLISTSANMSGDDLMTGDNSEAVIETFKPRIWKPDLMLDIGNLPLSLPSTVIDFSTPTPRVVRIGALNPIQLEQVLGIQFNT
jgi:L-threonylcarbamoyladenylate synthase